MQQLDQVVQQNAASSEELTATSEELATRAEELRSQITFFRLEVPRGRKLVADRHQSSKSTRATATPKLDFTAATEAVDETVASVEGQVFPSSCAVETTPSNKVDGIEANSSRLKEPTGTDP
jgi:methyl-accepting chemotaxis protein